MKWGSEGDSPWVEGMGREPTRAWVAGRREPVLLLFLEKRRWLWGRGGRGDRSRIVKGFNELCPMYSKGA